jgi:hypothetical protein
MRTSTSSACREQDAINVQAIFLLILPRIELHARIFFRHIKCKVEQQEAIAEVVALSWKWVVRLTQRGKDVQSFVSAIASFAAKAVKSGRRLCGQEKAKDVLSPRAQQRRGFSVGKLPDFSSLSSNPLMEALIDNTQTPPDEQAAFRIDFPVWLATFSERQRRIIEDLMAGERTLDVSQKYGISSARISQLRREFQQDWQIFCGDAPDHTRPS